MKKFDFQKCRLIVADIDGTLTDENRMLLPRTKKCIEQLKSLGIEFALASGRPLDEIDCLLERWNCEPGFFTYHIGMNGGELKDFKLNTEESFFKMDPVHLKEILDLMSCYDINPCIYFHGNVLCKRIDEYVKFSIQRTKKKAFEYQDVSELYQESNAKILFRMDPSMMDEVEAYAKQFPSPYWNVFKTGPFCLEFGDSRINKAYPLKILCERIGISSDQILAFGDTSNDNDLLQAAGWGVCMKNGTQDTKAAADDVTELNASEEGLADYIEKKILMKGGQHTEV